MIRPMADPAGPKMIRVPYIAKPLATLAPRDLLLLEALNPKPTDVALEVGTGSGSSLLRLAPKVAVLHGVDVSEGAVERLRRALAVTRGPARRVELFALDFCDPASPSRLPCRYDLIFSCDTVEHVPRPDVFFRNLHGCLKPGGQILATFPNEHPRHAHGITQFELRAELLGLLKSAGFEEERTTIEVLEMGRAAERIMNLGWQLPRNAAKRLLRLVRGRREAPPQTFDETDFYSYADRLGPSVPLINAYCWAVMVLMSVSRPVFRIKPATDVIWDRRILIRARRCDAPDTLQADGP